MKETKNKQEYMRAIIILMRKEKPYRRIAKELGIALSTVYFTVKRFEKEGIEGLKNKPHNGRKPKITKEQREKIKEIALKSPKMFGFLKNTWNIRKLARFLSDEIGIKVSRAHLWRILKEEGIVYKRAKTWVKSSDKDYEKKATKIRNYKRIVAAFLKKNSSGFSRRNMDGVIF
jgi:transposase